jgi:hypothetical protein
MRPLQKPNVPGMPHTDMPGYIYHLSWLGIILWFAFPEQLTPAPEEISLMTLGYISIITSLNPLISGAVAAAGLLTADNLFFHFSLKGNKLTRKLTDKTNTQMLDRLKLNFQENAHLQGLNLNIYCLIIQVSMVIYYLTLRSSIRDTGIASKK